MADALGTAAIGAPMTRIEGSEKVTGQARYALEYDVEGIAHAWIVGATVANGRVRGVDASAALALPGALAVLWHENAPPVASEDNLDLAVMQRPDVAYRGEIVAVAIADSLEVAREAAALVRIDYEVEPHDVALRADHPKLYKPDHINPSYETDTGRGDVDEALTAAAVTIDATYSTPAEHNNPMEPHASLAWWHEGDLTLYDATQGASAARDTIAKVLGLAPERVRVIAPHVGGGFGAKGTPKPNVIAAALAAQHVGRPVKLAVTRQQMFVFTGYRTPTIQRMRLGAGADGTLTAISHEVVEQTSTTHEFAEQTALPSRMMYAAPNRRTTHRLARLNVPTPFWMRAPGEAPGMYALECAMDELAIAGGFDPIELRMRNDPDVEPESGVPFSSRNLVACLREGAERFGWAERDPAPAVRRDGRWLVGSGVASSTYPARRSPSQASARAEPDGSFVVGLGAADIGTGARTALTQIAADALGVGPDRVLLELGDSALPWARLAGGSMGTSSWGSAVVKACEALRAELAAHGGQVPAGGLEAGADTKDDVAADDRLERHAFGAQFAEVRVDADTAEVRVARLLGVFAVGRIINPITARSQLIGGMTMGLSMALHEESVLDLEFGDYLNHDLAQYHVAACADVLDIEATWIDEADARLNPMGSKGVGEIGIVGSAAAIANAVHHATGIRVRDLSIRLDRLIDAGLSAGG
jgi:xanthine dehydrogenase YagR molybdenum-binding subunit